VVPGGGEDIPGGPSSRALPKQENAGDKTFTMCSFTACKKGGVTGGGLCAGKGGERGGTRWERNVNRPQPPPPQEKELIHEGGPD